MIGHPVFMELVRAAGLEPASPLRDRIPNAGGFHLPVYALIGVVDESRTRILLIHSQGLCPFKLLLPLVDEVRIELTQHIGYRFTVCGAHHLPNSSNLNLSRRTLRTICIPGTMECYVHDELRSVRRGTFTACD